AGGGDGTGRGRVRRASGEEQDKGRDGGERFHWGTDSGTGCDSNLAAHKVYFMTSEELVALARGAAAKAYAPYSKFQVGCAIESIDGDVVTGANMENACYRLGICAEQSALTAAQHKFGLESLARIAVVGGSDATVCTPCGGCRQAILEAAHLSGRDIDILCGSGDGSVVERHTIGELIPFGFGPANLDI